MSHTQQQLDAIAARGKTIVSAAAGSGKTTVMIDRLVSLIEGGESVENILAVTFTNKAAAQMRERARRKLIERYRTADETLRAHIRRQLDALPLADICTVHSFCGRLVRTYFYLVDVDPKFRIRGDDGEDAAIAKRAEDETFERAYEQNSAWFGRLLSAYYRNKKDETLRKALRALYASVRNVANYRERLEELLAETAEDAYSRALAILRESFRSAALKIAEESKKLISMSETQAPKGVNVLLALAEFGQQLAGSDVSAMCEIAAGTAFPPCPNRSKNDPAASKFIDRIRAVKGRAEKLAKNLGTASDEICFADFANAKETADALIRLALAYDECYAAEKRESGVLDYDDLEHLALEILKDGEVRAAVREKYRFLFVDEYQDINPLQNAILDAVSGEEVFFVGDKKQAIYGFRGSSAKFFGQQERALGGALPLDTNFRSAPAVLDAVNLVFSSAMEGYVPMTGGERFPVRGEIFLHTAAGQEEEPSARGVYSVLHAQEYKRDDSVARTVLSIVRAECGREIYDADLGCARKATYGDIAVLVRKQTSTARAVLRMLYENGIPVTATAETDILEFPEAQLLLNILSYLDNRQQDIPLASAMLSPLGGFSDSELARIRMGAGIPKKSEQMPPFRTACIGYPALHPGDPVSGKLTAFFARAERLRVLAQVKTASEIMSLLLAEGLEAQIAAQGGEEALARVFRLTSEGEGMSVHAFLKKIEKSGQVVFTESGGEGAVKMSTMHASKGLEYPIVILLDLDTSYRMPDDKDEILWTDELGISPKCFDFAERTSRGTVSRLAAKQLLGREVEEGERNLLYVAMTRAKCKLHLVFEKEKPKENGASFAALIPREELAALSSVFVPASSAAETASDRAERAASEKDIARAAAPYGFPKSVEVPVKDSATGLIRRQQDKSKGSSSDMGASLIAEDATDETALFSEEAPHTREEGLAYHAFLEHVDFGKSAKEELARMQREGLLTKEELALLDLAKLEEILAVPALASLRGKKLWRERKFLVTLPAEEFYETDEGGDVDVVFQGALDLLVWDEKGYHIIDYKYSSHGDDRIRADYAPQIRLYRKAVAKIFRVAESAVRATVINIASQREIIF